MSANFPQILLFMCNDCKGLTEKVFPDLQMKFAENIRVLPIECPSQIEPWAVIKLLEKSCNGVIIACPKDKCCCPANKKIVKRRETVKDILPVFGLHREQFQIASVSLFGHDELVNIIENMLAFLKTLALPTRKYDYLEVQESVSAMNWLN